MKFESKDITLSKVDLLFPWSSLEFRCCPTLQQLFQCGSYVQLLFVLLRINLRQIVVCLLRMICSVSFLFSPGISLYQNSFLPLYCCHPWFLKFPFFLKLIQKPTPHDHLFYTYGTGMETITKLPLESTSTRDFKVFVDLEQLFD